MIFKPILIFGVASLLKQLLLFFVLFRLPEHKGGRIIGGVGIRVTAKNKRPSMSNDTTGITLKPTDATMHSKSSYLAPINITKPTYMQMTYIKNKTIAIPDKGNMETTEPNGKLL